MTPFQLLRVGEHQAKIPFHMLTDSAALQLELPNDCLKNKNVNAKQIPKSHNFLPFGLKSSDFTGQNLCFNSMQNKIYTSRCFYLEKHS